MAVLLLLLLSLLFVVWLLAVGTVLYGDRRGFC